MSTEFGYTGKILKVDLDSTSSREVPTSGYADRFVGGRGIAARIYWDEVPPKCKAFDPENRLIFMTGPLAGYPGIAGSRSIMCTKNPFSDSGQFYYGTMGGSWGAHLKFTGYDGVVINGKSEKPVYILIQDGNTELRDASSLWGKDSAETRELLKSELGKSVKVLVTGPAGENLVTFATTLAEEDSATQGAAVLGSKKLKAIVVSGKGSRLEAAHPEKLAELQKYLKGQGYGSAPWSVKSDWSMFEVKKQICYGCVKGCDRVTLETADGIKSKVQCAAQGVYSVAKSHYKNLNDPKKGAEVAFYATRLCHNYGLEVRTLMSIMNWLMTAYKAGFLTEDRTGLPLSKYGSWEFFETLVKKISLREDFGDILAEGLPKTVDSVGGGAKESIPIYLDKKGQGIGFGPREFNISGLLHATGARTGRAVNEISYVVGWWQRWLNGEEGAYLSYDMLRKIGQRFWGSELTYDFSTYNGKAIAAKRIQDRLYASECLILCSFFYPLRCCDYTETHEGDPTIESKLYSAVTGKETDEEGLNKIGERIFNLERAILAREDPAGRKIDDIPEWNYTVPIEVDHHIPGLLVPGEDGEPITKKGNVVDRDKFSQMLSEYYELRGWDKSGLQTKQKMTELGLEDVAQVLAQRELIV